jgi:hypothetical protein
LWKNEENDFMTIALLTLRNDYWETFEFVDKDLDFLYNHLLEVETPLTSQELVCAIVTERIQSEKDALQNQQQAAGKIYLPKDQYSLGQKLLFPALEWKRGEVIALRTGRNPDLPPFDVIEVKFDEGDREQFAANLAEHPLNRPLDINLDDPNLDADAVIQNYGQQLMDSLNEELESNPDLVRIAGRWFPRALLVDVNIGYLNLAEALLDMEAGGPLATHKILEQIELPTDTNLKLTEFSLNLALQEDGRFDEVGPAGEVLWFLRRLEPKDVQEPPVYLRHHKADYDRDQLGEMLEQLESSVADELIPQPARTEPANEVTISLIYPHWRAGTLPLTRKLAQMFPTAFESPRVRFTFVDADSKERFSGWVVRPNFYVYGLRKWYEDNGLIPGSLIHIRRSNQPGEVIVKITKKRSTREWIRTALVGADNGLVFAMLKQTTNAAYDDRLVVAIPDSEAMDKIWEQDSKHRIPLEQKVLTMMRELTKLSPQGHVHAQELYAAVNTVRRSPPGPILNLLVTKPWANHLGDLYFRLDEDDQEGNDYA